MTGRNRQGDLGKHPAVLGASHTVVPGTAEPPLLPQPCLLCKPQGTIAYRVLRFRAATVISETF